MIQQHLIYQVSALVIQGVLFDLPLKFLYRIEETAAGAIEQRKLAERIKSQIFDRLHGRN
jgi:hypothetical protein